MADACITADVSVQSQILESEPHGSQIWGLEKKKRLVQYCTNSTCISLNNHLCIKTYFCRSFLATHKHNDITDEDA
jgi:hypothetical protein